jgi:hypothetical protein
LCGNAVPVEEDAVAVVESHRLDAAKARLRDHYADQQGKPSLMHDQKSPL